MEPAIAAAFDYSTPFEQCLRLANEAGFRIVSLGARPEYSGFNTIAGRKRIAHLLSDYEMMLDNVHSGMGQLATIDKEIHKQSVLEAITGIEAAADLGIYRTVDHLSGAGSAPGVLDREIDQAKHAVGTLLERALKLNVVLMLENSTDEPYMTVFRSVMKEFDDPSIRFCYDTSHDELYDKGQMTVLGEFGHRLDALHVSDNLGKDDDHMLPFEGVIDWEKFTGVLASIPFQGRMLLECVVARSQVKDPAAHAREAYSRAERLIEAVHTARGTE